MQGCLLPTREHRFSLPGVFSESSRPRESRGTAPSRGPPTPRPATPTNVHSREISSLSKSGRWAHKRSFRRAGRGEWLLGVGAQYCCGRPGARRAAGRGSLGGRPRGNGAIAGLGAAERAGITPAAGRARLRVAVGRGRGVVGQEGIFSAV